MMKTAKVKGDLNKAAAPRSSLKIGEVSKQTGIGIEALRFYERSGLLGTPARSMSGYRLYDAGVLERLAFIKKAQTLGFSLDEIKKIISDAEHGASPCDEVREIVRRRLAELDEKMREMRRYRKELAQTLEEWDAVGRAPGHVCGLIETAEMETNPPAAQIKPKKRAKNRG